MMKEYIEDIEERMANEENSDVLELYKIVLGMRLRDRVSKREDMKSKWLNTPKSETLDNFIVITSKRINEFETLGERDGRKAAEERADEERTRAELERRIRRALTKEICRLDDELRYVVADNQDQIVDAIVNYAMEHIQHPPEPIVSAVMGEIRLSREQVIRENIVNAGLIDAGIRSFLTDVNIQPGCSVGMGRG